MKKPEKGGDVKNKEKKWIIWVVLLAFFIFFMFFNSLNLTLLWDENVYLANARSHVSQSNFSEDFRFPLLEWLIASVWVFSGGSVFVARTVIILMTLATVLLVYLIGKRYFSWQMSLILCLFFVLSPLLLFWGIYVYADIPAMFFVTLSFYFILKSEEKKDRKCGFLFIALAGIFSALAFLARFPLLLFAFSYLCYLIINKKIKHQIKYLVIFILAFLVVISPWLIYNQVHYNNPVWDLKAQYSTVQTWTYLELPMKQVLNLFIFTNLLIPLLLLLGLYVLIRKNEKLNHLALIYIIISFAFYLFFVKLKDERYYFAFLPFIYLSAAQGFKFLFDWINNLSKKSFKKFMIIILFGILIVSFLFNTYLAFGLMQEKYACERNSAINQAINYLRGGAAYQLNENDTVLSNIWPWFGYSLNVKAFSFWSNNIDALIKQYRTPYAIYSNRGGTEFNKEILDESDSLELEKEFMDKCGNKVYIYNARLFSNSSFE